MIKILVPALLAFALVACNNPAPATVPTHKPTPTHKPVPAPAPKPEPVKPVLVDEPPQPTAWKRACVKTRCRIEQAAGNMTLAFSAYAGDTATLTATIKGAATAVSIRVANGGGSLKPRCRKNVCTAVVVLIRSDLDKMIQNPTITVSWNGKSETVRTSGLAQALPSAR